MVPDDRSPAILELCTMTVTVCVGHRALHTFSYLRESYIYWHQLAILIS
jgi:hypothetical protein